MYLDDAGNQSIVFQKTLTFLFAAEPATFPLAKRRLILVSIRSSLLCLRWFGSTRPLRPVRRGGITGRSSGGCREEEVAVVIHIISLFDMIEVG